MYWIKDYKIVNGNKYIVFEYFVLEARPIPTLKIFNPATKTMQHSVTIDFTTNIRMVSAVEDFISWYSKNIKL